MSVASSLVGRHLVKKSKFFSLLKSVENIPTAFFLATRGVIVHAPDHYLPGAPRITQNGGLEENGGVAY